YGLSTPSSEQFRCISLIDKAKGYGMEGVQIDGNNLLTVYDTIRGVRDYCIKNKKPFLIEAQTFRMRGHEEASGTKYVPASLFELWEKKDPVKNFEQYLASAGVINEEGISTIREEIRVRIDQELELASQTSPVVADTAAELADLFAPVPAREHIIDNSAAGFVSETSRELRLIDAIKEGLHQSMGKHEKLVLMGQDIAEYGGAFKITDGFLAAFGKDRVRNTPLCESAILGAALGLSLEGYKSMVEMQFADFVSVGFNQIVNNLAKIHYRWGQNADVVVRMPSGGGVGAGPFHSQSTEAWFVHTPGLKVVYPSTPMDAKGLMIAAINDPNPVMFFEHKGLYRSISGPVPEEYYEVEIGKARMVKEGTDLSVITYGSGVHWATDYAALHPGISLDILDLRTLLPLDYDAIRASVERTGKVIVLHEDSLTGGIGGEIAAWIAEHCFDQLDAPVMRCASLDTPIPFSIELEKNYMANSRLGETVEKLLAY
ncbi:MAG: dehydrogenase, partial [Chitinophagaceae bacterium]